MNNNLYLDIHVLQTLPPSCVNRDDTGSPKTAMFGGTMRSRVSSQAWKRAMRLEFNNLFSEDLKGYRTKHIKMLLIDEIKKIEDINDQDIEKLVIDVLEKSGIKSGSDKKDVLFFISSLQIKALAKLALQYYHDVSKDKDKIYKDKWEKALNESPSIDMLLFGRMAANNVSLNYDAAAQVAHSISTHSVSNEYDYFTAVDDCNFADNSGAGHLGTVEFNSSTMYRFATVNVNELSCSELKENEIVMAVRGFVDTFIYSMPTGKQNTFANRTLPCFVYVTLREDQPVNMSGAFEKAIRTTDEGYEKASINALKQYATKLYENYINKPKRSWIISIEEDELIDAERVKKNELLDAIESEVLTYITERK